MEYVNEEICSNCPFEKHVGYSCCAIYRENGHVGKGMTKDEIAKMIHGGKHTSKNDYCEHFVPNQGCSLEERPTVCKEYACYYLKTHVNN